MSVNLWYGNNNDRAIWLLYGKWVGVGVGENREHNKPTMNMRMKIGVGGVRMRI